MARSNNLITVLRSTLQWPEGPEDTCALCGRTLRVGARVAVVDTDFHQEHPNDGLYVHSLCCQELAVKEGGNHCPVKNYGEE